MNEISLQAMTRELCHALFRHWENDPDIYDDLSLFKAFQYDPAWVDRYFDAKRRPDRVLLAVMLEGRPIGEVQLKQIDREKKSCVLSIHMQNDRVKNKGYGTMAERLALDYAFGTLGLDAVLADCILKNTRSQHVLQKAGFRHVRDEGIFRYYQCDRVSYQALRPTQSESGKDDLI